MIDWTPTYLAMMRPVAYRPAEYLHWQGAAGLCWACTTCYAIEMRAIIQGYPARQLSPRYNGWTDGVHDTSGTSVFGALGPAQGLGICLEALMPMPSYVGVDTTTQAYGDATQAAVTTTPSAEADADALNQKITDWWSFSYNGLADLKIKAQAAIAAGHILCVITANRDHVTVAWGCDDRGLIVMDSRGQSRLDVSSQITQPGHMDWSEISYIAGVVRSVRYANAVMGPPPTPLPWPPVVVIPPPLLTGNKKMLTDIVVIAQAALTAGVVTQAQKDALISSATALVADVVVPPLTGDWTVVLGQSGIDDAGKVWSLGPAGGPARGGNEILADGRQFAGGFAKMLQSKGGQMYHLNTSDQWFVRVGGGWKKTTAP